MVRVLYKFQTTGLLVNKVRLIVVWKNVEFLKIDELHAPLPKLGP